MTTSNRAGRDEQFLDKLRQIVLDNLANEEFGVEELAKSYGISRSQLHRKLRKLAKKSISRFIREIRLDEAHKLLQENVGTVSEIAYKVGFSSPTYFNTCFSEYFGYPPGEAKYHFEKKPSTSVTGTSSSLRNTRLLLIGLIVVVLVALGWLSFNSYQNSGNGNIEELKPTEKSIAVLPFKNWSGDPDLEYVSDGMTDAVILRLSKLEDIDKVIPFTSAVSYKNSNKQIPEIARELNVQYILEGNFKLSGIDVQSNLNLIEVATGDYLWSLEYIGKWQSDQIFEIQAEVAENVANYLSVEIAKEELTEIQHIPTSNKNAYLNYLKAEFQFNKLSNYGLENAVQLYKEAIELDSTFVEPYIGLARTYYISGLVWGLMPEKEAWNLGKPVFQKAMTLDSLKGGKHAFSIQSNYMDGLFYYEYNLQETLKHMLEGMEQAHIDVGNYRTDPARKVGRFDIALEIIDAIIENNPTAGDGYMQMAVIYFLKGEKQRAVEILDKYDPLYRDNYFYLLETARWYFYMKEIDKSRYQLELLLEKFEDRPPIVYWLMAVHAEVAGEREQARSNLEMLKELYRTESSGSPAWFLAMYFCHIKDYDNAFEWLQKSYDAHEVEMTWLKEEPLLRPLRTDPRYEELYKKMRFPYPIVPYKESKP